MKYLLKKRPSGLRRIKNGHYLPPPPSDTLFLLSALWLYLFCKAHSGSFAIRFFLYFFIYLAALGLSCSTQDLSSLLQRAEYLVEPCGIQFPDQESNPGPLHWELGFLATGPTGKSHNQIFETSPASEGLFCVGWLLFIYYKQLKFTLQLPRTTTANLKCVSIIASPNGMQACRKQNHLPEYIF